MPENVFERAILWVAHPALLWRRVGGMGVLERQLYTAARAGIKKLWVAAHEPEPGQRASLRVPPGLELSWIPKGKGSLAECAPPYLGLSGDHFLRVDTLSHVAKQSYPESAAYEDAAGLAVIQVVTTPGESMARRKERLPDGSCLRLDGARLDESAVDWLMAAGPKSQDGFMARHFDRHISLAVSRRLLDTRVTPNAMTLFSTALGLAGAALFLGATRAWWVSGALLVWLHSVLDGCDGELARVRFQESPFGADLDFWGDNLVHLALFSAIGLGLWGAGQGTHVLALSAVADATVVASAAIAWRHRRAKRSAELRPDAGVVEEAAGSGLDARLSRLQNSLAQRDFIYLLVLLAFVDRVHEFLWATAVGGVLYFAIMLHLKRGSQHEQARHPHPAR